MAKRAVSTINQKKKNPIKMAFSSPLGRALTIGFNKQAFKIYSKYYQRSDLFECIEIETINRCNNTCPFCPVNIRSEARPLHKMDDAVFQKIIDELSDHGYSDRIAFYSNNEPYLDEHLIERIVYARKNCPDAFFFIYTNGTLLDTRKIVETIEAGMDQIVINHYCDNMVLDGRLKKVAEEINQPKYLDYRRKIKIFVRKKNEIKANRGGSAPNKDIDRFKDYLPLRNIGCPIPFRQIVVRSTGEISLCCNDALGAVTLGDVREQTLKEIWSGQRFNELRDRLLSYGRKDLDICQVCDTAHTFREFKIFFQKMVGPKINLFSRTH
jgi:MoaA/NifB/PqqE/SkfB family radical SAM enzyme